MISTAFDWEKTSQLSIPQILIAFIIPSSIGFLAFRVVLPFLVESGSPPLLAYLWVGIAALLVFTIAAIFLLRREAVKLGISFWMRLCMKKVTLKQWGIYISLGLGAFFIMFASQKVTLALITGLSIEIPDYMPYFLNPTIDPLTAGEDVLSPGLPLVGSFFLIPLMAIFLLLNILTEELYFRAWMQPKLVKYGHLGWVLNGTFFALYHSFQLWLFPTLLVAGLTFAFIFYKSRSIWPVFAFHLMGNFLMSVLGAVMMVLGKL